MAKDSLFCCSVHKEAKVMPLGLQLWSPPGSKKMVIIVHIDDHGLFAKKLKVGMQLHRINNVSCDGLSVDQIKRYLQDLSGRVSIITKSPQLNLGASVSGGGPTEPLPIAVEMSDDDDTSLTSMEDYIIEKASCAMRMFF